MRSNPLWVRPRSGGGNAFCQWHQWNDVSCDGCTLLSPNESFSTDGTTNPLDLLYTIPSMYWLTMLPIFGSIPDRTNRERPPAQQP